MKYLIEVFNLVMYLSKVLWLGFLQRMETGSSE